MPRKGENIFKRKNGRWEGRYIKGREKGKAVYGYVFGKSYLEAKKKKLEAIAGLSEGGRQKTFSENSSRYSFPNESDPKICDNSWL